MILRGPSGTGKTSAARIMLQGWEAHDKLVIDGAKETGVNYIRDVVTGFASSPFRTEELRLCFIHEADHLSSNSQASLRVLIERTSDRCRSILALNDLSELAALRSRLFTIDFSVRQAALEDAKLKRQDWYARRLTQLGVQFDRMRLDEIVRCTAPISGASPMGSNLNFAPDQPAAC